MTKKILFAGCSLTAGIGWHPLPVEESRSKSYFDCPELWTNLVHQSVDRFRNLDIIYKAVGGASNTRIFEMTVEAISAHGNDIDTVFCQWTSGPRYDFNIGFEQWSTHEGFLTNYHRRHKHDVLLSTGERYPRQYIIDFVDRFVTMHHVHWEIVKIVRYHNAIVDLTKQLGIKNVFFVNGLCPWDQNFFIKLSNVTPDRYTDFTKKFLLQIDCRTDEDIYELYHQAHQHYADAGGVDPKYWVNLYQSFWNSCQDRNFDNHHPGKLSNQLYCNMTIKHLQDIGFITNPTQAVSGS